MKFGQFAYPAASTRPILIFGLGELARLACTYFSEDSPHQVAGFIVDPEFATEEGQYLNQPVYSSSEIGTSITPQEFDIFVAFSGQQLSYPRSNKVRDLLDKGFTLPSYVSSYAFIASDAIIGNNVMIFEHNTIQSEVTIGDSTILWSGNHIGHQTSIGEGVFISSHVCIGGRTKVENNCYFGMNSTVRDQVTIGENTVVGSNSYVHRDFAGNAVIFGVPAKVLPGSDPMKAVN
jgi:sugar O-acyltransferase (sialic acid O-acetyltransferase NeuD family)